VSWPILTQGQRIRFTDEKQAYTVQAVSPDGRWVIVTKPFNARRTVLYSVMDMSRGIRGRDNHYGLGYETRPQILRAMAWFRAGVAEVSYRSWVWQRFADDQPDQATAALLPALRANVLAQHYPRQNDWQPLPRRTVA
jgi:hypothetical protein